LKIHSPYTSPYNWLKGNFHCHTTLSDGMWMPEEAIARYRDDGYDFLAITDHSRLTRPRARTAGRMLLLPGEECHVSKDAEAAGAFPCHVVGLGLKKPVPRLESGQALIDAVKKSGGLAFVAHPRWNKMPYEIFDALDGYDGFEVHNGNCEMECGRGFSVEYWDRYMTATRKCIWAVGVDDMHLPSRDFATGWTYVNAAKNPRAIYDALRRGDAYASCGPRFETIAVRDNAITVTTSAAKAVKFISTDGRVISCVEGEHVKRASFRPKGSEVYVRVEVHAADGRIAWSNPFFIDPD
jgi:hypothetical protein